MAKTQSKNNSSDEILADKLENWRNEYRDRVLTFFMMGDEERGNSAFQSWERRFVLFLQKEIPALFPQYKEDIQLLNRVRHAFVNESVLEAWRRYKDGPLQAFLTQAVEDARKGYFVSEVPEPTSTSTPSDTAPTGRKIFIGHGRSPAWRDLKDLLQERLHLEWDEFNREPTAGITTKERLAEMLEEASFAFLVMTAEDEHYDNTLHARENVIHEVGLFQGKLGFRKAIVLLEEGCAEFSNITGLTHISFPKGKILAASEEIRRVLEREGIMQS